MSNERLGKVRHARRRCSGWPELPRPLLPAEPGRPEPAALGAALTSPPPCHHPQVVELLCVEVARAFQETGTPLPPWRQQAAMMSKWQPRRSGEVVVEMSDTDRNNALGQLPADKAPQHACFQLPTSGVRTVAEVSLAARPRCLPRRNLPRCLPRRDLPVRRALRGQKSTLPRQPPCAEAGPAWRAACLAALAHQRRAGGGVSGAVARLGRRGVLLWQRGKRPPEQLERAAVRVQNGRRCALQASLLDDGAGRSAGQRQRPALRRSVAHLAGHPGRRSRAADAPQHLGLNERFSPTRTAPDP